MGDGQGHLFYDKLLLHPLLSEEQFRVRCFTLGLPWQSSSYESAFQCRGLEFHPWLGNLRPHKLWGNKAVSRNKRRLCATTKTQCSRKKKIQDFSGGAVAKNPLANVSGTGSIPDLGRVHMLWNN